MSTHKSVTPSPTNQSNRAHGAKHVAVYLRSLLDYHLPSHRETLFLHDKGPLHQILLLPLPAQELGLASSLPQSLFSTYISALTFGMECHIRELILPVKYLLFEYL